MVTMCRKDLVCGYIVIFGNLQLDDDTSNLHKVLTGKTACLGSVL